MRLPIRVDMGLLEFQIIKAVDIDPKSAEIYLYLGFTKNTKNDHEDAIRDLSTAIDLDQQYADAYFMRALSSYQLEDFDGTIADASKALEYIDCRPLEFT